MGSTMTPLNFITNAASTFPEKIAYYIPRALGTTLEEWTPVTYGQLAVDVRNYAKYWTSVLRSDGVIGHSVVVLWCVILEQS